MDGHTSSVRGSSGMVSMVLVEIVAQVAAECCRLPGCPLGPGENLLGEVPGDTVAFQTEPGPGLDQLQRQSPPVVPRVDQPVVVEQGGEHRGTRPGRRRRAGRIHDRQRATSWPPPGSFSWPLSGLAHAHRGCCGVLRADLGVSWADASGEQDPSAPRHRGGDRGVAAANTAR